jgi:hypothetical protein
LNPSLKLVSHFELVFEKILQPLVDLTQFGGVELLHGSLDLLDLAHCAGKIPFRPETNKTDRGRRNLNIFWDWAFLGKFVERRAGRDRRGSNGSFEIFRERLDICGRNVFDVA